MPRTSQTTMDWDQGWYAHPRIRALRRQAGERWPTYLAAYLALVAEAWRAESPDVTLDEAWEDGIPCTLDEAQAALEAVGMVTPEGRLPPATYLDRVEPGVLRKQAARAKGRDMAQARWDAARSAPGTPARSAPSNADSNAPSSASRSAPSSAPGSAVGNARPSVRPTDRNSARSRTTSGSPLASLGELLKANGLAPELLPSPPEADPPGDPPGDHEADPAGTQPDPADRLDEPEHEPEPDWQAIRERWAREAGA